MIRTLLALMAIAVTSLVLAGTSPETEQQASRPFSSSIIRNISCVRFRMLDNTFVK